MLEYLQVAVMIGQLDDPRAVIFIVRHLLDLFAAGLDQGIEVERLLIRVKAVVVSKGQAGIKCVDELDAAVRHVHHCLDRSQRLSGNRDSL